jgi:hypothetical protein
MPPRAAGIGDPHRIGDRNKTAHACTDDGRGALALFMGRWRPTGLFDSLLSGPQCEQDEAVHLLLFLGRRGGVGIEPRFRVISQGRYRPTDLAW